MPFKDVWSSIGLKPSKGQSRLNEETSQMKKLTFARKESASTVHTSKRISPLEKLPPELRNAIWHLVLLSNEPIECPAPFPPLLQTNHAIRAETGPIYFGMNWFHMTPAVLWNKTHVETWRGVKKAIKWLELLSKSNFIKHLRKLIVQYGSSGQFYFVVIVLPGSRNDLAPSVDECVVAVGDHKPNYLKGGLKEKVFKSRALKCLKYLQKQSAPVEGSLKLWAALLKIVMEPVDMRRYDKLEKQTEKERAKGFPDLQFSTALPSMSSLRDLSFPEGLRGEMKGCVVKKK